MRECSRRRKREREEGRGRERGVRKKREDEEGEEREKGRVLEECGEIKTMLAKLLVSPDKKKLSHCCCISGLLTASFKTSCRTHPMTG